MKPVELWMVSVPEWRQEAMKKGSFHVDSPIPRASSSAVDPTAFVLQRPAVRQMPA
jgi:hypothetical protein